MCPLEGPDDPSKPIPTDPRSSLAIARMNWIHSHYKISNDDLLYTMSVFIFQTTDMMRRCDWRAVSPEESECFFILWTEIGQRMGIQDIPPTVDTLREWSLNYEAEHMVPSEASRQLAQLALKHISRRVPNMPGLRRLVSALFICLMDEPLRIAMMLPAQPTWAHRTVKTFCHPSAYIAVTDPPCSFDVDGRMRLYTLV
ncbi:hypothetical protein R3P38DRAFT_2980088 [Favolaschia claudopus]|uniref:ER-bound oxygenase mpaB/mpaB'/Rubber oxygenase catalytic domain-containing protein n=1 Tax=Favolaschia claudopus TaxID=2862362 RepID=A0AAW0AZH8_9AGAR